MGFVANAAARALSLRRFKTVGAIIPNIENEEFIRAISALQKQLGEAGYTLLLTNAGYDLDIELRGAQPGHVHVEVDGEKHQVIPRDYRVVMDAKAKAEADGLDENEIANAMMDALHG